MTLFLSETRSQNHADLGRYDPHSKTLFLEVAPGRTDTVDFPLRPGTFEHLNHDELREVALFLKLKGRRSADTLRRYSAEMEKFLVFLKCESFSVIDEWTLMAYQEALLAPSEALRQHPVVRFNTTTPETTDQYMNVVRSFIQQLTEKRLLSYNVAKQVPSIGIREKSAEQRPKCFSHAQWEAVLDTLGKLPASTPGQRNRKERLHFCISFTYALGLRVSEAAHHTHTHLVKKDNEWGLKVIGKGLRARYLTLTSTDTIALDALHRFRLFLGLSEQPQSEALPLLPKLKPVTIKSRGPNKGIHINPTPISRTTWEEQFKGFLRLDVMQNLYGDNQTLKEEVFENEWAHLTPHSLRHTRITHLVEQGKDLFWIQQFAGHENLNTTRRYFHAAI